MSRFLSACIIALGVGIVGPRTANAQSSSSAQASPFQSFVQAASAVVVGYIDNVSFDGSLYRLQVRVARSLKGTLSPGTAVGADFRPSGPRKAAIALPAPEGAVLVAMEQDEQGSWHLFDLAGGVGLSGAYFGIPEQVLNSTSSVSGTPMARIAQMLAAAAEFDSSRPARFVGVVAYRDAPNVFDAWSRSSSPRLRAYGLGARIAARDASAVASVASAFAGLDREDAELLSSTLSGYRNPAPNGVIALGKLATTPGADPLLVANCAYALREIHTKESVPFLAGLLDNGDRDVRRDAVAGLSEFVTNVRITNGGLDGSEALDEVMNPGRRRSLPSNDAPFETVETRAFLHFGPFQSDAEEASVIGFWKNWYKQNRAQFQ